MRCLFVCGARVKEPNSSFNRPPFMVSGFESEHCVALSLPIWDFTKIGRSSYNKDPTI